MSSDAELKLLAALCASAIRGEPLSTSMNAYDGARLVQLARRHRVQGLAWVGLTGGTQSKLPGAAELFADSKAITQQNLLAVAASSHLLDHFNKHRLRLIFLKGLTLGALAYPRAMLKMSTDIDVLVDLGEIHNVEALLRGLGYRPEGKERSKSPGASVAKEWTWIASNGVVVDLHVRLADNTALLPAINAHSSIQQVEVAPGVLLPTLRTTDLFAYLCVHGSSSSWFRLKWVADFAAFLHGRTAEEVRDLYATAQLSGAGRCPDVAVMVVERIFGPLMPRDLLYRASGDPLSRWLARISLRELARTVEPLERHAGTIPIHLVQLFMGRGLPYPARELWRQAISLIA